MPVMNSMHLLFLMFISLLPRHLFAVGSQINAEKVLVDEEKGLGTLL